MPLTLFFPILNKFESPHNDQNIQHKHTNYPNTEKKKKIWSHYNHWTEILCKKFKNHIIKEDLLDYLPQTLYIINLISTAHHKNINKGD